MDIQEILSAELKGSVDFYRQHTNLDPASPGYGLTVDSTKKPQLASIASTGFALTAWVIGHARGYLDARQAVEITRGTLRTLNERVSQHRGFFAHYLDMRTGLVSYAELSFGGFLGLGEKLFDGAVLLPGVG